MKTYSRIGIKFKDPQSGIITTFETSMFESGDEIAMEQAVYDLYAAAKREGLTYRDAIKMYHTKVDLPRFPKFTVA